MNKRTIIENPDNDISGIVIYPKHIEIIYDDFDECSFPTKGSLPRFLVWMKEPTKLMNDVITAFIKNDKRMSWLYKIEETRMKR